MALTPGQEKCINSLDRSLVVAAGAGSGKTFTLTKRIVSALMRGHVEGIDRVLAITFTNKAAGELKARLKAELRAAGMLEEALKVDEAWVSTIHGMCARILKAHAVELDLDPKFKMADAAVAVQLEGRAVDSVLADARVAGLDPSLGLPGQDALDALFAEYPARSYGPGMASVESFVQTLMELAGSNVGGFGSFEDAGSVVQVQPVAAVCRVLDAYDALVEATRALKPNESREAFVAEASERVARIRAELESGLVSASDGAAAMAALRLIDSLPVPKRTGSADYKTQVADVLDLVSENVMRLRLAAAAPHLATLVALARQAQARYAAAKRAEGVLDNNDLLVLASAAIAGHPEIAALYTDRFQLVMVDEFQDTDQMQVDMIKRLAGPGACRLCTVGDAQQSIYRFRGADVAVYRRHLESVRASDPDAVIMLPDNFRSHADVLAIVDRVFERPDMFGGEFMSLAPGRDEARVKRPFPTDVPRVQVQLTSKPSRGVGIDVCREHAARRIADVFADLHDRGHSAGEMAVLLGGMTHADVYAAALREHGLSCVISGGSVFSDSAEAAVVLALARVIADPHDTESLFNVLTSPLFQLDAGDLLELATSVRDGEADVFAVSELRRRDLCAGLLACVAQMRESGAPGTWSPRLELAVRVMGAVFAAAGRSVTSRVIMRAAVDSGWVARLQARGAEGLASAANVYKAVRIVEGIERSQAAGPSLVASLFQVTLEKAKEAPGALSAAGGDFVRIMTVHASKGLEFPIVAVAELRGGKASSTRLQSCAVDGRVRLSLDLGNSASALQGAAMPKDVPGLYAALMEGRETEDDLLSVARDAKDALELRAALCERDARGDAEEAKRLLYVALTRAKEALVVSLCGTRTKENPLGTPTSVLGALVPALAGPASGFEVGTSHLEYGGTAPALVEHVALEVQAESEGSSSGDAAEDAAGAEAPFAVPVAREGVAVRRVPFAPAHEGVFSYSSVADASHEGDMLERMAEAFSVSVDAAYQGFDVCAKDGTADSPYNFVPGMRRRNRNAAVTEEDDGSWAYTGALTADDDKATDLGTAFHRLAQYAVESRRAGEELQAPPSDRIAAMARACELDGVQRERLMAALARWIPSDLAHAMAGCGDLRAEVPFFLDVPLPDTGCAYLEGEIDLLGLDGSRATVVDYKTGGHADEPGEALRRKHVLQAACYAYAVMRQGVHEVEAVFARVEQPRADDPAQPQCVRYRFHSDDLPALEQDIVKAYVRMSERA